MGMFFTTRREAGEKLLERLKTEDIDPEAVFFDSRESFPLGKMIAEHYGVPLDIVTAETIHASGKRPSPVGAVSSDGTLWIDDAAAEKFSVSASHITESRDSKLEKMKREMLKYRGSIDRPRVAGMDVLLATDGISTGMCEMACIGQLLKAGAGSVTLASPLASREGKRIIRKVARVISLSDQGFMGHKANYYGGSEKAGTGMINREIHASRA